MRPYFAILKDSFREAFASRVFWVVLILIIVLLLLMFPLGYRQQLTTGVSVSEVKDWPRFIRRIVRQSETNSPSPGKHIISMLNDKLRNELLGEETTDDKTDSGNSQTLPDESNQNPAAESDDDQDEQPGGRRRRGPNPQNFMIARKLVNELNDNLLTKLEFYDPPSWERKRLRGEAEDLIARDADSLTDEELQHRNRLLLDSAFPNDIAPAPTRSVQLTYLGYDITANPFRVEQKVFQETIQLIVLWGLLLVFGTIGIFASILVTASIIPQTFDPGSLNLLLSKPISRSVMFITQYFGGCVFIGIWASMLFSGIFLFLGMRLDYWNPNLLFYIPSFVFVFAIYYSVSALIGLVWRSPIMATVITLVFWIACAGVGWLNFGAETFVLSDLKSTNLIVADDVYLPMDEGGTPLQLKEGRWISLHTADSNRDNAPPALAGSLEPVFDPVRKMFITQQITVQQNSPIPFIPNPEFSFAAAEDGWKLHLGEVMPAGVIALLPHPIFGFVAVTSDSVFKYAGELKVPEDKKNGEPPAEETKKSPGGIAGIFGRFASQKRSENFVDLGPNDDRFFLASPFVIAVNHESGDIAAFSRGMLFRMKLDDTEKLQVVAAIDVEVNPRYEAKLVYVGDKILLAPQDEPIMVFDENGLKEIDRQKLELRVAVRHMSAAPDNSKVAIVFQNQHLWTFDAKTGAFSQPFIPAGNNVNAADFDSKNNLVYVDDFRCVRVVDLDSQELVKTVVGTYTTAQNVSRYLIKPLHSVFPQPGRLNNTVQFFVTGDDTREDYRATMLRMVAAVNPMVPLGQMAEMFPRVNLYPWPPVWNGIAFLTIMLFCGCLYIERQQF